MMIGIDAGTSVVKAAAFSNDGENLAVESRPTKVYSPSPDQSEQDFEEVVAAVGEVVRAVTERSGEDPDAIGLTGQGDGLWLFDERGYSVRPAILWLDARANSVVEEWMSSGVFEAAFRRNGNIIFPGSHAPLLVALERSEPESADEQPGALATEQEQEEEPVTEPEAEQEKVH